MCAETRKSLRERPPLSASVQHPPAQTKYDIID